MPFAGWKGSALSAFESFWKGGDVSEIRKLPAESLQKLLGRKKRLKNWDAPENLELAKRQEEQWKKKEFPSIFVGRSVSKTVEGNFRSTVGAV
ncbi:MAG: hypothetical protein ACLURV_08375 [Gallintestinimicrobium sp.]